MKGLSLKNLLLLAVGWMLATTTWLLLFDSCARRKLAERWFPHPAPTISPEIPLPGELVVENPYFISSCGFQDSWESALQILVLCAVYLALGFLTARRIRVAPIRTAAILGCIGITWGVAVNVSAYPDIADMIFASSGESPMLAGILRQEITLLLVLSWIGAAVVSAFGAFLATRWRRGALEAA